jgi:hypothetical protein
MRNYLRVALKVSAVAKNGKAARKEGIMKT